VYCDNAIPTYVKKAAPVFGTPAVQWTVGAEFLAFSPFGLIQILIIWVADLLRTRCALLQQNFLSVFTCRYHCSHGRTEKSLITSQDFITFYKPKGTFLMTLSLYE
jgi:hypothetical protein